MPILCSLPANEGHKFVIWTCEHMHYQDEEYIRVFGQDVVVCKLCKERLLLVLAFMEGY